MNMSKRLSAALLSVGLAVVGLQAGPVEAVERDPLPEQLESLVEKGAPGAVGQVRRGWGRTSSAGSTEAARGVADLRSGRAAAPGDRYRIGSNTKTMTSVVVLQLVEEKRLRLDDRVADLLPRFGLDRRILVRHLLQHTSGFHTDTMIGADARFRYYTPDELVRLALTNPDPRPEPGMKFEYSNTNYVLAGLVIERLTGRPATDELRRRIFEPLGMRETSFPTWNPFIAGRHLNGYLRNASGEFEDYTVFSMSYAWTAGAVISTGADQTRFLRGLFGGRLLSRPMLARMLDVGEFGYGLGIRPIRVDCVPGGVVWGHNGAVPGYHSAAYSTPDGRAQSAVAVNTFMLDANGGLDDSVDRAAGAALCDE